MSVGRKANHIGLSKVQRMLARQRLKGKLNGRDEKEPGGEGRRWAPS